MFYLRGYIVRKSIFKCGLQCREYNRTKQIYHLNHLNYQPKYNSDHDNGICNKFIPGSTEIVRYVSISHNLYGKEPLKPSSKVEVTVENLKQKQTEEEKGKTVIIKTQPETKLAPKKSIKEKIVAELTHYYHGFRLLFIDMKISLGLVWRMLNGHKLTRREYRLLIRTTGDMFRLVPFSVFIIVPFMELLLPVFIKFFPGMLPSTFQTATEAEDKNKKRLKVKLEMAKFLQETLDNMSLQHKDHYSEEAKKFTEWFHRVRTSGELVSTEEIMKYSKLFEDEITLDSLSRNQLIALCRVLEIPSLGTNYVLRFQLRMKLRSLAADDKMIQSEGVDSLTLSEVQQACRVRGMRAYGVSEERLRCQLSQWLDLSLNEKVPPSLLLLSRALMLPETIPTGDQLKATIYTLPDAIVTQTKAAIGEKEGKIDNRVAIELLKQEEKKIKEERKEQKEEKEQQLKEQIQAEREVLIDTAPILTTDDPKKPASVPEKEEPKKEKELERKDIEIIETALDSISKEKKFIVEKEELEDLKEEMEDYAEDLENLQKAVSSQKKPEIKESKAAKRLYNKVNKMINKLDNVMVELNKKEEQLKKDLELEETEAKRDEVLKIEDIINAIKKIKDVPDQSRLDKIGKLLVKMDDDQDGSVRVENVLKILEILGNEDVKLTDKQFDELIELINKEEILELQEKIDRAVQSFEESDDKKDQPKQ